MQCVRLMLAIFVSGCGYPKLPSIVDQDGGVDAASALVDSAVNSFLPSHLDATQLLADAPDLMLNMTASTIDTSALTVNGAPDNFFVTRGSYAVLFTRAFVVQNDLKVTGDMPLIVVASDRVTITGNVDLGAKGSTPGPGALDGGAGAGLDGTRDDLNAASGAGGGSYASLGGFGGTGDDVQGDASGPIYGSLITAPLNGGSWGGIGGGDNRGAGAGGGALQISSQISISISGQYVTAGGGGGGEDQEPECGGSGGGSGGEIFLEAPMLTLASMFAANGGGGGGGGFTVGSGGTPASVGSDGGVEDVPAMGGTGGVDSFEHRTGGAGGTGAAGSTIFMPAQPGIQGPNYGGGGGGGVGRIWLRYRASSPPSTSGAHFSPPATFDSTIP